VRDPGCGPGSAHSSDDVHWSGVGEAADLSFDSHTLAFCLHGASQNDNDIYVIINAYWQAMTFVIQEGVRVLPALPTSVSRRQGTGSKALITVSDRDP